MILMWNRLINIRCTIIDSDDLWIKSRQVKSVWKIKSLLLGMNIKSKYGNPNQNNYSVM